MKYTIKSKALNSLELDGGFASFYNYAASNSTLLPHWWSETRETRLRQASIENDIISSVIQTVVMKLFTLPVTVVPRNPQVNSTAALASTYTTLFQNAWNRYAELFLNDLMVYDKGAFLLIEGNPNVSQPLLEGQIPTGFKHIPSQQIILRDDEEYPYKWQRDNGKPAILLHNSRVIRLVQMPISISNNNYAGLSFVSRAFNIASLLTSSIQYGLEGLGRIDSDQIIWATSVTSKTIQQAFKEAELDSLNTGLKTNGRRVYLGMRDPAGKVGTLDLKRLPANFNYETFLRVTVKLLAIAAGIDEDDIAATSNAGTTKTAVLISDLKSRYKLISWFTTKIVREFENKFLPPSLMLQVGETSDEINESEAKTRINIARTDELMTRSGALTVREQRKNAVRHGFITQDQFDEMELENGRLPNGLPVYTMFYSTNEMVANMINIGINDPCNVDPTIASMAATIALYKLCDAERVATNTTSSNIFKTSKQVIAALNWFIDTYTYVEEEAIKLDEPTEDEFDDATDETLTDETADQEDDNVEQTQEKKRYYLPTTVSGRAARSNVRKAVRDAWNNNTTKNIQAVEKLLKEFDAEETVDELTEYVKSHARELNGKLTDIYTYIDNTVDWDEK